MRTYTFKLKSDSRDNPMFFTEKVKEEDLSSKHIDFLLEELILKYKKSPDIVKLMFINKFK